MMAYQSRITLISGVVAAVLAMGCKSDNSLSELGKKRIEGQLFIVQKNRENIKLGDVKVILVERNVFDAALDTSARKSRYLAGLIDYRNKLSSISRKIESDSDVYVRSQNEDVRISAEYALKKLKRDKLKFSQTEFVKTMSGHLAAYNDHEHRLNVSQFEGNTLQKWCLSYLYYSSKSYDHLEVTTTDADGKFSLNIPANKDCLVLAKSSRSLVGDKEESCHWAHPIDPELKGALILSNSNMISPSQLRQMLAGTRVELKSLAPEEVIKKYKFPSLTWYSEWREAMRGYNKAEREEDYIRSQIETKKRELDGLIREG